MQSTRFAAMGTECHVVVVDGGREAAVAARDRAAELEGRWSRFRPDSELCRLNAHAGQPVVVSPDTFLAVRSACDAWRATAGAFDPTVLDALEHAGYDRSFAQLAPGAPAPTGAVPAVPGCRDIVLDEIVGAVTLPAGVRIDLGGIGKGLAADLIACELVAAGAAGAMVNLGGDLRTLGDAPNPAGWTIALHDRPASITIGEGGVATSAVTRRRWMDADGRERHHVIDTSTATSATTVLASVSVIASSAARAEVLATAALVAGSGAIALLHAHGASGIAVARDGAVATTDDLEALAA